MRNDYLSFKYRPFKFYLIVFLVSFAAIAISVYCSYNQSLSFYKYLFIFAAVLTPAAVAMFMIFGSGNDLMKNDFINRLANLKLINWKSLLFVLLLAPLTVLLATAISLLFAQPARQLELSPGFSMAGWGAAFVLIAAILAPTFEELGWRGYGVDSLAKKGRSLLVTTLIFAAIWDVWHWPLFLVQGYYHSEIWQQGIAYGLNFIVSIFPIAFLHNWIYWRNGRSIPIVILFHAMNNIAMSLLQTEQFTKCIITVIWLLAAAVVLIKDRALWLNKAD